MIPFRWPGAPRETIVVCWEHQFLSPRGSAQHLCPEVTTTHGRCPRTLHVLSLGPCPLDRIGITAEGMGARQATLTKEITAQRIKWFQTQGRHCSGRRIIPSPKSPHSSLDSWDLLDLQWSGPKIFQRAKPCLALINEHWHHTNPSFIFRHSEAYIYGLAKRNIDWNRTPLGDPLCLHIGLFQLLRWNQYDLLQASL